MPKKHPKIDLKNLKIKETVEDYLGKKTWKIKENSTQKYSYSSVSWRMAGETITKYTLSEVYPKRISNAHLNGGLHIHNLYMGICGYCAGWSIQDLLMKGVGVPWQVTCAPAKHFDSALNQLANFFGVVQNEWAGAQAINSLDIFLAPFIRKDRLSYKEVKQGMQGFIYALNLPTRWGGQTPFTNITFDLKVPDDLANKPAIIGGKVQKEYFKEFQSEVDMINKAFMEVMLEGDSQGRAFEFPIPTYNITKDFNWNSPITNLMFEMTAKYGIPYFQNFIRSDLDPHEIRAMCLHASEELLVRINGKIEKMKIGDFIEKSGERFDEDGWGKLKIKAEVISLNKDFKLEWAKIKRVLKIKDYETIKIKVENGREIKVSKNHLVTVLTPEGFREKFAKDIKKGDFLIALKDGSIILNKEYQKIGDYVLDEKLAKLLGYFLSEGNYLYENRKNLKTFGLPRGIQFSFNEKENNYIKEVSSILEKKFGKKPKTRKDPRYSTITLLFYDANLARMLKQNGVIKPSNVFPQIWNSSKSVIKAFLEGFFNGDGSAKDGDLHINDKELFRELALLYHLIGKPVTLRWKKDGTQSLRLSHGKEINSNGTIGNPLFFERVPTWNVSGALVPGISSGRTIGLRTLDKYKAHNQLTQKIKESNIFVSRVTKVSAYSSKKAQKFYDIELEKNHRFVHSLGNITHNCCHLRLKLSELKYRRVGGYFGYADKTGSVGVVTINLPRIGYLAKNEKDFYKRLEKLMDIAKESLEIKRKLVEENMKSGLLPFSQKYLGTLKFHFSTIGLVGMNEACQNFLGKDIATEEGKKFAIKVLNFMRKKLVEYQKKTGNIYNLEATPAESTCYRLAKIDKECYPKIKTAGIKVPYYTNSTLLPVDYTDDVFKALTHQNDLQTLYTGGTVLHVFLGEKIKGKEAKVLMKKILENYDLPYLTITPTFSVCPEHGYLMGEHFKCPKCGKATEVYSRVVGFLTPVQNWNIGKREEFKERLEYKPLD